MFWLKKSIHFVYSTNTVKYILYNLKVNSFISIRHSLIDEDEAFDPVSSGHFDLEHKTQRG